MAVPENIIKQRARIMYVYKILLEETDEEHSITMPKIIEKLNGYGVSAARKAIYDDINALKEFGADIETGRGSGAGYSLLSRDFELPELTLLADAVSSSKFITQKKSSELIRKLEGLASRHEAAGIERQIYVADRVKTPNEKIYINIDVIHRAVAEKKKIEFRYFGYDANLKKKYHDGRHICSPYALTWSDEHYYLVAHYEKYPDRYTNFRIDRMEKVSILDEPAKSMPRKLNLSKYLNSTFSMFSGKAENVVLCFENDLMNPVVDRFGYNITSYREDDEHFSVKVSVKTEQPQPFFAWLFQFGTRVRIVSPDDLRQKYTESLSKVAEMYREK